MLSRFRVVRGGIRVVWSGCRARCKFCPDPGGQCVVELGRLDAEGVVPHLDRIHLSSVDPFLDLNCGR